MFKSEKQSEVQLELILGQNQFGNENIYYTTLTNSILKELFTNSSKTGSGHGIPDRIYFDKKTLIIFECKKDSLVSAEKDLKYYITNIPDNKYSVYGVAFVSNELYSIFKLENSKIVRMPNEKILLNTFDLEPQNTNIDMKKEIHIIHNYIRDYTKISNEDKPFFVAIILISLKKSSFGYIFEKYQNKEFIYDILLDNLKDYEIDLNVFAFLRNDENNNHLYNLINMINNLYSKKPSIDLLNEFYSEFVKYNNSDGKKLGIVLTPPHIVSLMCNMLSINKHDTILDLCTGTGSFLLEANKYHPKRLIGCEFQNKLYSLLKCNVILQDINNIDVLKGNCFEQQFMATKSLINPPYGNKNEREFDFIIKQLDSLEEGGLACAIIPAGKLVSTPENNKYKKLLLSMASLKTSIVCRKSLFYPYASVRCSIILLEKSANGHKGKTNVLNYEDDGFESKIHSGWVKNDSFESKYTNIIQQFEREGSIEISHLDDWTIGDANLLNINSQQLSIQYELMKLDEEYHSRKQLIITSPTHTQYKFNQYSVKDLFVIENVKNPCKLSSPFDEGDIPLISATQNNNGVVKRIAIQPDTIKLNHGGCIIFSTCGTCFYQKENFYATSSIKILRPINSMTELQLFNVALAISDKYLKRFNQNRGFKFDIFRNDLINVVDKALL